MTSAREEFEQVLREYQSLPDIYGPRRVALQDEYNAAFIAAAKPLHEASPKRKRAKPLTTQTAMGLLSEDQIDAIVSVFRKRADEIYDEQKARGERLHERMEQLAVDAELRHGDYWLPYSRRDTYDYITQGWGAATYAKNACQLDALVPKHFGVEVEVVYNPGYPLDLGHKRVITGEGYVVAVKVESDVDVEIMKHRPSLSMRDFLKAAWGMGCNPRVLNPWLPPGLEEKLGIDYFGRDLQRKE